MPVRLEYGTSPDKARHSVRVESAFYPQLGAYYDARLEQWFAEHAAEIDGDEDGEGAQ